MPENIFDENVIAETSKPSPEKKKTGFEIPEGDSGQLSKGLSQLNESIDHDRAISKESLEKVESDFKTSKITIGHEVLTVEEAEQIPDLEANMKIWEEMRDKNLEHMSRLTFFPESLAEFLIPYFPNATFVCNLPNVHYLSDGAIKHISQYKTYIHLNGLKSITDKGAEYLGQSETNDSLELDGLESLSDIAAEQIFRTKNKHSIKMNGLITLSGNAMESLSHFPGYLSLNGLRTLTEKGAECVRRHNHAIELNGLTQISDEVAKYLSQKRCEVSLRGLTSISDRTAQYLSESVRTEDREGYNTMPLVSLKELSEEAARYLGQYRGFSLGLSGLTVISEEAAKGLSKYKGWLYLNGLTDLSDKAAEYLSKLINRAGDRTRHRLGLSGVTNISDKALSFLKKYTGELYLSDDIKKRMDALK